MLLQRGQVFCNRFRVSANQRAAKRLRRTEARIICQSLLDDGQALAERILARESSGMSGFFERHQERQQQRRSHSGPGVVGRLARRGQ